MATGSDDARMPMSGTKGAIAPGNAVAIGRNVQKEVEEAHSTFFAHYCTQSVFSNPFHKVRNIYKPVEVQSVCRTNTQTFATAGADPLVN